MSFAHSSLPVIPLTRDRRWMLEEETAKILTVGGDVDHFKLILTQKPHLAKPELKNTIASFE